MEKFLICENCKQVVARFDMAKISIPVNADMFRPKHADKDQRPFWAPRLESKYMGCPICPKRVFNQPVPERLYVSDSKDGSDPHWFMPRYADHE